MDENLFKEALRYVMDQEITRLTRKMESRPEHKFSPEFERKMKNLIRKTNRKYVSVGKYTVRRVVLVAIIAALLLSGCVGIKPIREAIIRYWIEITDENTTISMMADKEKLDENFKIHGIKVPEGYQLISEELWEEAGWYMVEYLGEKEERIYYDQIRPENIFSSVDTEGAEISEMEINGYKIKCISKKEMSHIIWTDDLYYFHLCGTCDIEILKEIVKKSI